MTLVFCRWWVFGVLFLFSVVVVVVVAKRPSGIQIECVKQTWEKGLIKGKVAGLSSTGVPEVGLRWVPEVAAAISQGSRMPWHHEVQENVSPFSFN